MQQTNLEDPRVAASIPVLAQGPAGGGGGLALSGTPVDLRASELHGGSVSLRDLEEEDAGKVK
jgi:hypothetical protein